MKPAYHILVCIALCIVVFASWTYWTYDFGGNWFPKSPEELIVDFIHLLILMPLCLYGMKACNWWNAELKQKLKDLQEETIRSDQ